MKTIKVKGMSCQHCVKAVTKALSELDGVSDVKVDLSTGKVSFEDSKGLDDQVFKEKLVKAGYEIA